MLCVRKYAARLLDQNLIKFFCSGRLAVLGGYMVAGYSHSQATMFYKTGAFSSKLCHAMGMTYMYNNLLLNVFFAIKLCFCDLKKEHKNVTGFMKTSHL